MGPVSGPPSTPTSPAIDLLGGRWFFGFLGDGLWFLNYVLWIMRQRDDTRRALPCRCQSRFALTRHPPSARVRASPARGGLWQLSTGEGGFAVVAPDAPA